ncbi:hypothetical protein [Alteromonas sp. 14N.309.X.WAT.G.H12]|uniref:hypothetical protein n=1 Tax=Alteromonas sp. 14N.309.X.WAT.G.H12 TaxID=3120824 RepID=UPI002FD0EB9F
MNKALPTAAFVASLCFGLVLFTDLNAIIEKVKAKRSRFLDNKTAAGVLVKRI